MPPLLPQNGIPPRVLILGSMPSAASLAARHYYAHPQNAFWPVLMQVLEINPPPADYARRTAAAAAAGIVIWDVLAQCRREGSMDGKIEKSSEKPNNIAALLHKNPSIAAIALNGNRAAACFRRHIVPNIKRPNPALQKRLEEITVFDMPSTSPAHARMSFDEKLKHWQQIADFCDVCLDKNELRAVAGK